MSSKGHLVSVFQVIQSIVKSLIVFNVIACIFWGSIQKLDFILTNLCENNILLLLADFLFLRNPCRTDSQQKL